MQIIDTFNEDHKEILRLTAIARRMALSILRGGDVPTADIRIFIGLIRDYADGEHHAIEERLLFKAMHDFIPDHLAEALVNHGMLAEHDQARFTVLHLETSNNRYATLPDDKLKLDILADLVTYARLLEEHTKKESNVAYPFGVRQLPPSVKAQIDEEFRRHLAQDDVQERRQRAIYRLGELEERWPEPDGPLCV